MQYASSKFLMARSNGNSISLYSRTRFHDTCRPDQTSQFHALLIHDSKVELSISLLAPPLESRPICLLTVSPNVHTRNFRCSPAMPRVYSNAIEENRPCAGKVVKHSASPADIVAEFPFRDVVFSNDWSIGSSGRSEPEILLALDNATRNHLHILTVIANKSRKAYPIRCFETPHNSILRSVPLSLKLIPLIICHIIT